MARMRGPDYGSMLRAIYEPKLKRQTAKEEIQLKRDALNETISQNKKNIEQTILDRRQREMDRASREKVSGTFDQKSNLQREGWRKSREHDILTRKGDYNFRGDMARLDRKQRGEIAQGQLDLGYDNLTTKYNMFKDQIEADAWKKDFAYDNLMTGYNQHRDNLTFKEKALKYPYEQVELDDFQKGMINKLGIDMGEDATVPRLNLGAITSGSFNLLGYQSAGEQEGQKLSKRTAAKGPAVPTADSEGKAADELDDWANINENTVVEEYTKYMDNIDSGYHSAQGAPTVWEKAMNSFSEHGDDKYGDQLIGQYTTMLDGITAENMGSWKPAIHAKRAATEKRIVQKLQQLFEAKGVPKSAQTKFFEMYKKRSAKNTSRNIFGIWE